MSPLTRKIKENILPFIFFVAILFGSCISWFIFHPASPYHKRYSFVVSYETVGTLSPGNRVEIRGITKGKILKVQLTEDAVFVTAEVLADTKIPTNSEFRLINSGLMGERELCVLTGDASTYISDGDTVKGHFDEGTAGISKNLAEVFEQIDSVKVQIVSFVDSLTEGSTGKRLDRVLQKGDKLIGTSKRMVKDWFGQAEDLLGQCDESLKKAKGLLENATDQGTNTVENAEKLIERANGLLNQVNEKKQELDGILAKLDQEDNTAGLILSKKGQLTKELTKLTKDIDALIADIKKSGVKMNVDIF